MDYISYFGLREAPFKLLPNSRFFFEGTSHRRAFSYLTFGLNKAEGFVVITGEIGAGKTTIVDLQAAINRFIAEHNNTEAKPFGHLEKSLSPGLIG